MYVIRQAMEKDLCAINDIYNWAVFNTTATFDLEKRTMEKALEWFNVHQNERYPLYVIEKEEIVGWGSLSPFNLRPAYRFTSEFSIYIDHKYHGKGLGGQLLAYLCHEGKKLDFHSLVGIISAENKASLGLAEKEGFIQVGYYKEVGYKFERWLDVVIMQKMI